MRINLVKIGNSKGLRLPKAVIDSCGIGTTVSLEIRGRELIIRPDDLVRAGWAEALAQNPHTETWSDWDAVSPSTDDEWTWPQNNGPEDITWPDTPLVSKSG